MCGPPLPHHVGNLTCMPYSPFPSARRMSDVVRQIDQAASCRSGEWLDKDLTRHNAAGKEHQLYVGACVTVMQESDPVCIRGNWVLVTAHSLQAHSGCSLAVHSMKRYSDTFVPLELMHAEHC